jgi:hypothetical protein
VELVLKPVEMTPQIMKQLEEKELIIRLCPGNHAASPGRNESSDMTIYASDPQNGPHKLIAATVNAFDIAPYFGTHVDNEEFLLIGDPNTKPLYLVIALHKRDVLLQKTRQGQLTADDFVALHVKFNDPLVSFFVMLKNVPHGEVTLDVPGALPSFYVTEPRDITTLTMNLAAYTLRVADG